MSGLQWSRVTFKPTAWCAECGWHSDLDATRAAKQHAAEYPGHRVITERVERGEYLMPKEQTP